MAKVEISPNLSCGSAVYVGKPEAITLTMGSGVYEYTHGGSLLATRCVQVDAIPIFRATVGVTGWATTVESTSGNTGSFRLKDGVLTLDAPGTTGIDTWLVTSTASSNGAKVKVKFSVETT